MIESKLELKIKEIVGIAIGEASMQWIPRPTGVFDSTNASSIVDRVTCDILNAIGSEPIALRTISIDQVIEHLVPEEFKILEDRSYILTKILSFRPFSQVCAGDSIQGFIAIKEKCDLPSLKITCERTGYKYIRTSPIVRVLSNNVHALTFETEGGVYELKKLDQ